MRVARTQPPVGYRVRMSELIGAAVPGRGSRTAILEDLRRAYGVEHLFALSSGKAALATVLSALRWLSGRRKVIVPAYTCYSVPSAIVKAGLEPVPCDLAPGSFDYDYAQLSGLLGPDVLCALSVHLFGIAGDTPRLLALCRPMGVFVVEDAAQAMDVCDGRAALGTVGDAGVFSLGRGKNITCGSGGLVVTNTAEIGSAIASRVKALTPPPVSDGPGAFVALTLLSLFISPTLFWLPAGLPFLKLGETIFHEDFPIRELSPFQARLLRGWRARLQELNGIRREIAAYYVRHINGAREFGIGVPYLRFPLLLEPATRLRILNDRASRRLGISRMYPTTVGRIPELEGRLRERVFPRAEAVAAGLVTLPTHPLLSRGDVEEICRVVNDAGASAVPRRARSGSTPDALAAVHH